MRAYVITTGLLFLAIVIAHAARIYVEGVHVLTQPDFLIASAFAVAMSIWAFRLIISPRRRAGKGALDRRPSHLSKCRQSGTRCGKISDRTRP